ncbi:MAG TPA: dTMP kinase [Polyangiaceae bacterium]|nr:dTMP kinase [Polyangiaceae bacterium]
MFVVFEGIDGSGKTSISNRVAAELSRQGQSVKHLRAEGRFASPVVEGIRAFARNSQHLELCWEAEFLLYVARDVQLMHEMLRPALACHDVVLADRFLYTSEVLARHARGLGESFVRPILTAVAGGIEPDLVILVDVDPAIAKARRRLRKLAEPRQGPPARKGLSGSGLLQRLRAGYLELAASDPARWFVQGNHGSLEESVQRVVELIGRAQSDGPARAVATRCTAQEQRTLLPPRLASSEAALESFLSRVDELSGPEPALAAYLLGGMYGAPVDARRRRLAERAPAAVLNALRGLDDAESHRLRRELSSAHPRLALRSLRGALSGPESWTLWQELEAVVPSEALPCLSGSTDARAWAARDRWCEREPEATLSSLAGLDDARAWAMRERLLALRGELVSSSYEFARALARSVAGLSTQAAWQLRCRARKLAPVAALASLAGLNDSQSWTWREQALEHAPKVVMNSLKGHVEPTAWRLREQVARHCKEALDGFEGVDSPEAWALREVSYDIWPSSVVKTLGPLAAAERGRAVIERQLAAYPEDISLLRHVARVALELNRSARQPAR